MTEPDLKGYIHDVGGPTANFRSHPAASRCCGHVHGGKHCLAPTTCSHMIVDHSDYLKILRRVRELPGVKKVFIRSGIRFDYLMADPDDTFFKELVEYHVSGQLKVAPEHCAPNTLASMATAHRDLPTSSGEVGRGAEQEGRQKAVSGALPCPATGSTLKDARLSLAGVPHKNHMRPGRCRISPHPGTVSTCMFYTGLTLHPQAGVRGKDPRGQGPAACIAAIL